ncbi:MAG TPA: family 10 glycosylhydrolase [Verrucomicrobiota bacterium]|nr:hypothetical protein [Verrucomicrobiales bacterium]HRI14531.1 family 10 glycosylhydrolase [Verrucomicrobiota bacterium]
MRVLLLSSLTLLAAVAQSPSVGVPPPPLPREMRGMWVASVGNLDWPSKSGLSVAQQQAELRALLDGAAKLNLNTVLLQVRPSCDALYESTLEPWSEYLTGRMGQAPTPRWDPLKFACDEAHARCLELHAWFNPFRARYSKVLSAISPNHVIRTHPEWIISYGYFQWLDPGNPAARDHVQRVVLDIVRRYDIDGIHFDDYFFPYPVRRQDGVYLPFADDRSYGRYRNEGGRLDRADWRRDSVNQFVQSLYPAVHQIKPWVKVGIGPFGIWRPDNPPGIKGLDQYAILYSDPKLWINNGWCDYLAPQLYWPLSQREQSFSRLLQWWESQNLHHRLMVPGLNSAKIGDDRQSTDIANQVRISRNLKADGVIFWNASSLRNNLGGVASGLTRELFARAALVPATPWLGTNAPAAPTMTTEFSQDNLILTVRWQPNTNHVNRCIVFRSRVGNQWQDDVPLAPQVTERVFDRRRSVAIPDEIHLVPIGRTGLPGEAAAWRKP